MSIGQDLKKYTGQRHGVFCGAILFQATALPVVNSIPDALKAGAVLVHENLGRYKVPNKDTCPKPGTNIANHSKIRKGNILKGWAESQVIIEGNFSFPKASAAARETRSAKVEIKPDGSAIVTSTNQGPFAVRKDLSKFFHIEKGKILRLENGD